MHIINLNAVNKLFPFIITIIPFLIALNHGVFFLALIPGFFLLVAALYSPFIALLIYSFFNFHPLVTFLTEIVTGCMFMMSFLIYWLVEKKQLIIDFTFLLFISMLITMFVSGIINESIPGNSLEPILFGFFDFFMYLLILNIINSKERLRTLIVFFIFFAVLQSLLASIEILFDVDLFFKVGKGGSVIIPGLVDHRATGSSRDPDQMAMMLLYVTPFIIGVFFSTHNIIWRRSLLLIAIFVVFSMFLGASRAAILSLAIIISIFFFFNAKVKYLKYYIYVIIFLVMILLAKRDSLIERFRGFSHIGDLSTWNESTASLHIRYLHYQAFGLLFKDYPILGIGGGNFYDKAIEYDIEILIKDDTPLNIFMGVVMSSGIIGLSIYILLLLIAWKNLVKSQKIVQECNDLEMLSYIKSIKYAFLACLLDLQVAGPYFAFPVIMSIGLSGAINQIVSSSTQINKIK